MTTKREMRKAAWESWVNSYDAYLQAWTNELRKSLRLYIWRRGAEDVGLLDERR